MSDYYRTVGFQKDKAQLLGVLNRIADSLERIAIPSAQDVTAYLRLLDDEGCTYTKIERSTDDPDFPVVVSHDGDSCPLHEDA